MTLSSKTSRRVGSKKADSRANQGARANDTEEQVIETVIPVVEEIVSVRKREVLETVRVRKEVEDRLVQVREALSAENVSVSHVPVNRYVDVAPETRVEGETTIVPVVEEVIVIQKRLLLKEEIHLTKTKTTMVHSEEVRLQNEKVTVDRFTVRED